MSNPQTLKEVRERIGKLFTAYGLQFKKGKEYWLKAGGLFMVFFPLTIEESRKRNVVGGRKGSPKRFLEWNGVVHFDADNKALFCSDVRVADSGQNLNWQQAAEKLEKMLGKFYLKK